MRNERIDKLQCYINDNIKLDSEVWYGGYSLVNEVIATFDDNDLKELVIDLKNWTPDQLSILSQAITADDGSNTSMFSRTYLYANIILTLDDYNLLDILDDFSFLENGDKRIEPELLKIKEKIAAYDFKNYDEVALSNWRSVTDRLLASFKNKK